MSEGTPAARDIHARLADIERRLRWHRRGWVAVLVLLGGLGLVGAARSKTGKEVHATRFVLIDGGGVVRGSLGVEPDGSAVLRLLDAGGTERLTASVSQEATLTLSDRDRQIAVKLVAEGGVPRLALSDRTGADRLWVALRFGSPAIQFLTAGGIARSGLVTINDDTGIGIVSSAPAATPGLVLYDKDRKIVWSAP